MEENIIAGSLYSQDGEKLLRADVTKEMIIIPDGVTGISENAFGVHEKLKCLVIPASVKYIGSLKYDCTIFYKGTKADWKNVDISVVKKKLIEGTIYFYTETKLSVFTNSWKYAKDGKTPQITHISII